MLRSPHHKRQLHSKSESPGQLNAVRIYNFGIVGRYYGELKASLVQGHMVLGLRRVLTGFDELLSD